MDLKLQKEYFFIKKISFMQRAKHLFTNIFKKLLQLLKKTNAKSKQHKTNSIFKTSNECI